MVEKDLPGLDTCVKSPGPTLRPSHVSRDVHTQTNTTEIKVRDVVAHTFHPSELQELLCRETLSQNKKAGTRLSLYTWLLCLRFGSDVCLTAHGHVYNLRSVCLSWAETSQALPPCLFVQTLPLDKARPGHTSPACLIQGSHPDPVLCLYLEFLSVSSKMAETFTSHIGKMASSVKPLLASG